MNLFRRIAADLGAFWCRVFHYDDYTPIHKSVTCRTCHRTRKSAYR